MTGQELAQLAMERLRATGPTDLARKLRLGMHGDRRVKRWLAGDNDPDYEGTIAMLKAVGMITAPAAEEDAGGAAVGDPVVLLRSLEATVEAQGIATARSVDALARDVRALARRLGGEDGQARKAR